MEWSAAYLCEGYERCLIGFDIRVCLSNKQQRREEIPWKGDWFDASGARATFETLIWPSRCDFGPTSDNNGFDLLSVAPVIEIATDSVLAAFDIPSSFPVEHYLGFSREKCVPNFMEIEKSKKFIFCGYDVVDLRHRSSSFYSFDWDSDHICELNRDLDIALNDLGIVATQKDAIKASIFFDRYIPSHAPFLPCGVWCRRD